VNDMKPSTPSGILAFAALVEILTGLALLIDARLVIAWLAGVLIADAGTLLGPFLGIALLALGLACWPERRQADSVTPAFRAMLMYSVMIALYLAYLGIGWQWAGPLLWPAVVLHAVVALLLLWTWRGSFHPKEDSR